MGKPADCGQKYVVRHEPPHRPIAFFCRVWTFAPGSTALSRRAEHPGFSASCHRRGCLRLSSGRTDSSRLRSLIRSSRSHATSPLSPPKEDSPSRLRSLIRSNRSHATSPLSPPRRTAFPGSAALSAAAGRTQLLRFSRRGGQPLPTPQPYPQTAGCTQLLRFPRRGEQPPPGSAALSAATGRMQLLRFPRRRRHLLRNLSDGRGDGHPPRPGAGRNRLSTEIDFIDINMPEIYLIYISCRTIFATATRKNNTNI